MRKLIMVMVVALTLVGTSFAATIKLVDKKTNTVVTTLERPLKEENFYKFAIVLLGDHTKMYPALKLVAEPGTNKIGFRFSDPAVNEKEEVEFYLNKEETEKLLNELKKLCGWEH